MGDSLDSVPFNRSWYEILNGGAGLFALAVAIIFVSIIIIVFIIRIIQLPRLRQQVIDDFNVVDNTRSVPTRILQVIISLLLFAGLVGVIYFNVSKMIYDPPKISVALIRNNIAPSMLFCGSVEYNFANYNPDFNNINEIQNNEISSDLAHAFSVITRFDDSCQFFNGTLFHKPNLKQGSRGYYNISFVSNGPGIIVFVGDNSPDMNWSLTIPQGNMFNDVGVQVLYDFGGTLQYVETRHTALDGKHMYRSFQVSVIETIKDAIAELAVNETRIDVTIIEPKIVINQVENPSLTLADLFSNVGGYLSIWGIFGFLFGSGKMDPFGFVARFVFIKQDRTKLLKELKKMKGDSNVELNTWEKEEKEVDIDTKTSNLSNQADFNNLLKKYYVETDYYDHAVKTHENVYINKV
ncbi:hypothetical protein C1646_742444 [Rhizophagus diaphanus]|nr:hypothetical protein C1646_742444 [Rhizophagus diaphanus] [Rhizophagus sp. MUCL 43196]